jgi:hypothetical protein
MGFTCEHNSNNNPWYKYKVPHFCLQLTFNFKKRWWWCSSSHDHYVLQSLRVEDEIDPPICTELLRQWKQVQFTFSCASYTLQTLLLFGNMCRWKGERKIVSQKRETKTTYLLWSQ